MFNVVKAFHTYNLRADRDPVLDEQHLFCFTGANTNLRISWAQSNQEQYS